MLRTLLPSALLAALAVVSASGCAERSCTAVYISHRIEMTRDFDLPASGLSSLRARLCIENADCKEGAPGADGRVALEPVEGGGPIEATMTSEPGGQRARIVASSRSATDRRGRCRS